MKIPEREKCPEPGWKKAFREMYGKLSPLFKGGAAADANKTIKYFQSQSLRIADPKQYIGFERESFVARLESGSDVAESVLRSILPDVGSDHDRELPSYLPLNLDELFEQLDRKFIQFESGKEGQAISATIQSSFFDDDDCLEDEDEDEERGNQEMKVLFALMTRGDDEAMRKSLEAGGLSREEFESFKKSTRELVDSGQVEAWVASTFLNEFFLRGSDSNVFYEALIESAEAESLKKELILREVRDKTKNLLNNLKEDSGVTEVKGSLYFGTVTPEQKRVRYRIYINPKLSRDPKIIIDRLRRLIQASGASIQAKIVGDDKLRADKIVLYFSPDEDEAMAKILNQLLKGEEASQILENITPDSLPIGIEIMPGVTLAAQPPLVTLAKIAQIDNEFGATLKEASANKMYANMFAMAFAMAKNEAKILSKSSDPEDFYRDIDDLTPYQERAKVFFKQMLILSQISEEMMPMDLFDGKAPPHIQGVIDQLVA